MLIYSKKGPWKQQQITKPLCETDSPSGFHTYECGHSLALRVGYFDHMDLYLKSNVLKLISNCKLAKNIRFWWHHNLKTQLKLLKNLFSESDHKGLIYQTYKFGEDCMTLNKFIKNKKMF